MKLRSDPWLAQGCSKYLRKKTRILCKYVTRKNILRSFPLLICETRTVRNFVSQLFFDSGFQICVFIKEIVGLFSSAEKRYHFYSEILWKYIKSNQIYFSVWNMKSLFLTGENILRDCIRYTIILYIIK